MQISVIIPVYNVEQYVGKCLDSLLAQSYTNFEAIVVDDGSTDKSGRICDEYAAKDSRIVVHHTKNKGVSAARNLAIQKARGEYLAFVDSDDYIEPDMLKRLYEPTETFQEVDCVLCASISEDEVGRQIAQIEEPVPPDSLLEIKRHPQLLFSSPAMWNKLYVREIITSHAIKFDPKLTLAEDLTFYLTYIQYCRKFVYVDSPLYHYIQRDSSAMKDQQCEKNRSVLKAFDKIIAIYEKNGWYEEFHDEIEYLAIFHILIAAMVRVLRVDPHHSLVKDFRAYMDKNFSSFEKNPYLYLLDKNKKMAFGFVRHKQYAAVRMLFQMKEKLRR